MDRITLKIDEKAPYFNIIDVNNKYIDLNNFKGKKLFIAFFRHAGCPFCNLRAYTLQKHSEILRKKNLQMIFFFESDKDKIINSNFHSELAPIPVISDPEKEWFYHYGIERSVKKTIKSHLSHFISTAVKATLKKLPIKMSFTKESLFTMPAEFLINEESVIKYIHYSNDLTDGVSLNHIYHFAENGDLKDDE